MAKEYLVVLFPRSRRVMINGEFMGTTNQKLELEGGGYAEYLKTLLVSDIARLYIVVRTSCLPSLIEDHLEKLNYRIIKIDTQVEDI